MKEGVRNDKKNSAKTHICFKSLLYQYLFIVLALKMGV